MKKLYIVKSLIKDWFTSQLPYTAAVMVVFILSFIAMFFVATKVATEYLEDTSQENIYYNELAVGMGDEDGFYAEQVIILNSEFYDEYLKLNLPSLTANAKVQGVLQYTEKNGSKLEGTDACVLACFPVFSKEQQDRYGVVKHLLNYYDYEITKGRDLTEEDLCSGSYKAVAPEGYALDVGDVISCFGHEIEIVGLNKPSPYSVRKNGHIVIPYGFADECMADGIYGEDVFQYEIDEAYEYGAKPENNVYVPTGSYISGLTQIHMRLGLSEKPELVSYPAFLELTVNSFVFEERVNESQKEGLAKLLGITVDDFGNGYDWFYHEVVENFNGHVYKECIIAGIFCALNVLMIIMFLSSRNIKSYRIYRMYGCSGAGIFAINFISLMLVVLFTLVISMLLCKPAMLLFSGINDSYEFRPKCVLITSAVLAGISFAACIPAAISAARKSPID